MPTTAGRGEVGSRDWRTNASLRAVAGCAGQRRAIASTIAGRRARPAERFQRTIATRTHASTRTARTTAPARRLERIEVPTGIGFDVAGEPGREDVRGEVGGDHGRGGADVVGTAAASRGSLRDLARPHAHRSEDQAFDLGQPHLAAQQLAHDDDRGDAGDGGEHAQADALRPHGVPDHARHPVGGVDREFAPLGEAVELPAQLVDVSSRRQRHVADRQRGPDVADRRAGWRGTRPTRSRSRGGPARRSSRRASRSGASRSNRRTRRSPVAGRGPMGTT